MRGLIFDIQRGALNDGPGIRTTIFFKGCPLKCPWCHNPESKSSQIQLKLDQKRLKGKQGGSGKVKQDFKSVKEDIKKEFDIDVNDNYELTGEKNLPEKFLDKFDVYGRYYHTSEIIHILQKDLHFYEESGGGLTISGGEPLQQFPFLLELCKSVKTENINICLDTSGYTQRILLEQIQPYIDWFLFDIKTFNPELHRAYCGGDLEIVLKNLDFLSKSQSNIIIRSPIIPGFNDSDEHILRLKSLQGKYPEISSIELLPYHNFHSAKYDFLPENLDIYKIQGAISQKKINGWKRILSQPS